MNVSKKNGLYYIIATIGFVVFLFVWQGASKLLRKKPSVMPTMRLSIAIAKPHVATVKRYVEAVGQCTAFNRIDLVPQIEGTLIEVAKPNGGLVQKGTLLFKFDDASFKAYVQQSEAQLAKDKAAYALSLSQLKRSEGLRSGNFVSQQEYDSYKANVEAGEAVLSLDEASCALKRIDLGHCYITAPFTGELSRSLVDAHSFVSKGVKLATLNQLQPIYVDTYLSEKYLVALQNAVKNAPDEVTVEARLIDDASVVQRGQLVMLGNEVEKKSGTFDIRAQFDNSELQFWPGRGIDLKIFYKTLKDVVLVPESAIHQGNRGCFVYVVNANGVAEMQDVVIDQVHAGWVVVLNGLTGNEQVVATGHVLLAPGMPVQVTQTLVPPAELR